MKALVLIFVFSLSVLPALLWAEEVREVEDISIIGNQELPTSLIIVPWKGAELNDEPNLPEQSLVDERFQLVTREQLLREIEFHKIQQ